MVVHNELDIRIRVMPYMEMVRQLRRDLEKTHSSAKKQALETQIVILLGLIETMEKVDVITSQLLELIRLEKP